MAMTRRNWSLSALAVEFGIDRRTAAARLKDVEPSGEERGHPVWRLADAAEHLVARPRRSSTGEPVPLPSDLDRLNSVINPIGCGMALMAAALLRRVRALTAAFAVSTGASCRTGYATSATVTAALLAEANRLAESLGLDAYDFEDGDFDDADWKKLAKIAGETTVDVAGWRAWTEQWLAEERPGAE